MKKNIMKTAELNQPNAELARALATQALQRFEYLCARFADGEHLFWLSKLQNGQSQSVERRQSMDRRSSR